MSEATVSGTGQARRVSAAYLCALAAVTMAFGWGYRGVVGHEGGAMVPGAMLGMAVCLASGRLDWYRRAAVAGLFGAVGWAWGGSLSYMEHPKYSVSDSFPDVLYGYAILFFMGALWAGIGGAILGLAFTLPRSRLRRFVGPFTALCGAFLATHLYLLFHEDVRKAFEQYTVEHWHDGDWFSALTTLVVAAVYWIVRPKDRPATALFFWCAVGWWVGYLGLTKFGGLLIAPPQRSESWGGVLGILVVLVIYLARRQNRAALLLCLYGLLGGGFAFALAVFIRHPFYVEWGPFAAWRQRAAWKIAEESFGFFMGLAIALGALRLLRGGLRPAEEDEPRKPLDVYAVFVVLIALMWVNLRRAPMDWIHRYETAFDKPVLGMMPWLWYFIGGCMFTALALYGLYLYRRDALVIVPPTAFGKGAIVFLFLLWLPVVGAFIQHQPAPGKDTGLLVDMSFWALAALATWMVIGHARSALRDDVPAGAQTPPDDPRWRVGLKYWLGWAVAPVFLIAIAGASTAMQDGGKGVYRKRFGPDAYWRQVAQLVGTWEAVGVVQTPQDGDMRTDGVPVQGIEFHQNRDITVTYASGEVEEGVHRWRHSNVFMQLSWYDLAEDHPDKGETPLVFEQHRLYIAWPPPKGGQGYVVFQRARD